MAASRASRESIKIVNGAVDVVTIEGVESVVLRGVVDPDSMRKISVPDYQREVLSAGKIQSLKEALMESRVPDIDLGMRGEHVVERDEAYYLQDPVYVIDGLQRTAAGVQLVEAGYTPHIGALIHFNTNEQWERSRFQALNKGQTNLSNNVTLRNMAASSTAADTLLRITQSDKFVLQGRVCWNQQMKREHLITAITLVKTVGLLHSHAGPCRGSVLDVVGGLEKVIGNIGRNVFMHNVREFFAQIDAAFGLRNIAYRSEATQVKMSFLRALALTISKHENFWDGDRLQIPKPLLNKLSSFPLDDPTVRQLAGSAGKAPDMLELMFVEHINKGKRTQRLRKRSGIPENMEQDGLEQGDS